MGLSFLVLRMRIIIIVYMEFMLKASSEITGHSLGRTIGLRKRQRAVWCRTGWTAKSTEVQNGFKAPKRTHRYPVVLQSFACFFLLLLLT